MEGSRPRQFCSGSAAGLVVYVTSRSEEKRAHALEIGAAGAFAPGSRLPHRVDAVLDTVGKATWDHSLEVPDDGRHGGRRRSHDAAPTRPPISLGCSGGSSRSSARRSGHVDELPGMCAFLEQTGVRPLIDSEIALADARAAFTRLDEGSEFGKIVCPLIPIEKGRTMQRLGFVGLGNLGRHLAASLLGRGSR